MLKGRQHENIKAIQVAAMMESTAILKGIHQLLPGLAVTLATAY
jgi:hypothetical protein